MRESGHHAELVSGVTAENYAALGRDFIKQAGKSFLITRRGVRLPGASGVLDEYPPTPGEWGAWLGYFLRKRIRAPLMATRDFYTVPAQWPHLFDAEATVAEDVLASEAFLAGFDSNRRYRIAIPDADQGFVFEDKSKPHAAPFRPYPRVWEAFAGDREAWQRLESGLSFESVTRVSFVLAQEGREAARGVLLGLYPPPQPAGVQEALKRVGRKIPFERRPATPIEHLRAEPEAKPWDGGGSEAFKAFTAKARVGDIGEF